MFKARSKDNSIPTLTRSNIMLSDKFSVFLNLSCCIIDTFSSRARFMINEWSVNAVWMWSAIFILFTNSFRSSVCRVSVLESLMHWNCPMSNDQCQGGAGAGARTLCTLTCTLLLLCTHSDTDHDTDCWVLLWSLETLYKDTQHNTTQSERSCYSGSISYLRVKTRHGPSSFA